MDLQERSPALEPQDAVTQSSKKAVAVEQGKEAVKDVAFGSLAGIMGKFVEYPFDTVKVRLQSQTSGQGQQYSGPLDCLRKSWQQGGMASLYRGISAPLVGAAVETSSLFFSVSSHDTTGNENTLSKPFT